MNVVYHKAAMADYDDVIDFGNYVFSHAHISTDFPVLLPKLYRREYFMEGLHYLAREEGGGIKAALGAYPMIMNILGEKLPGRGIGMVSVHPYARSRGYMRTLMNMALEDMQKDGVVFSCLGGQRQRYEYFGYAPAGTLMEFSCSKANIRHTLGKDFTPALALTQVLAEDRELLGAITAFHESKIARIERRGDRVFPILSSWRNRIYAFMENGSFAGYLVYNPGQNEVREINLKDFSRTAEALGLFLNRPEGSAEQALVAAQPQETEKLEALSRFAEYCKVEPAYHFAVLDWAALLPPLLKLKARINTLAEGSVTVKIGDRGSFRIAVSGGVPSVAPVSAAPDISLTSLEAVSFFFSHLSRAVSPQIRRDPFLQSLLPLPLFFEGTDEV
ncbi:MAG: GNAT family N-acetyltransferase [Treponema sp.]|jgi:predicted N-acetyltransferase YhbS|nr:GNAT family N-acetyltransferase [Treponema sp.]